MKKDIKILFAAAECAPLAKVGGLGDVVGGLPKALKKLGQDVGIILPKYGFLDGPRNGFKRIFDFKVGEENVFVWRGFLPESDVLVYLLENENFFSENGVYFEKTAFVRSLKEIKRFLFFSRCVLEFLKKLEWKPNIVHCHDWHLAALPFLAKRENPAPNFKTILTIHNVANQGKWGANEVLEFLEIKKDESVLKEIDKEGNINIFSLGIKNADILTTVSETYAKELLTKEFGEGLEEEIFSRKKDFFGIVNAIDDSFFNPEKDRYIKANYSAKNLERKAENKADLQKILGLEPNLKAPLLGVVSRLTNQKGIDLILESLPDILKENCQMVILGVGSEEYEKRFLSFSEKYPKQISANILFNAGLAQKIYAGCDIFLMPSKFEPCGLGQLISQRYGTLPLVRKTGGLADTVLNEKNGFVFEYYNKEQFFTALKRALIFYSHNRKWKKMMENAMSKDFSWLSPAKEYLKIYSKLVVSGENC